MITGLFLFDWALISVSLFNAILLLWLGLTVFLNAERRTRGVWLVEEGLMLGALFFVSHTAILGRALMSPTSRGLEFWWRIGWMPVVLAPFAWYILILWYVGFWESRNTRLYRRHRLWLALVCGGALILVALMSFTHALPSYERLIRADFSETSTIGGIPVLFMIYPLFAVPCIALPLDALLHPEPSQRVMGDLARQRARPWLFAVSAVLLVVSLSLIVFMAWGGTTTRGREGDALTTTMTRQVAGVDLLLASLLAVAIVLLGQAIVTYEIFTGKTLPRRGFFRHWRNAIILAAGYATLVGWSVTIQLAPIYSLLLSTLLMVAFYALISWRSFVEREEFMARLRPFVSSQRLMQHLLDPGETTASRADRLFCALCGEVLGARQARLIPLGALAPLAGPPLSYPNGAAEQPVRVLPDMFRPDGAGVVPLEAAAFAGLHWAIPLWAERGLIGALLLGPKLDNGLYTQEEIEIARVSAERIVDMLAGEQMARRVMDVQRRRLTETRVLDLRTRRVLHDDVLPTLHAAILGLSGLARDHSAAYEAAHEAIQALSEAHQQISTLIHTSSSVPVLAAAGRSVADALRMVIEGEFSDAFNAILWTVEGSIPVLDPLVQDVVLNAAREVVRNAAIHGRGADSGRSLTLAVSVACDDPPSNELAITIGDDGVGLDTPSRSLAEGALPQGSGGGLALHSTMLALVGGSLVLGPRVEGGQARPGTQVVITLPLAENRAGP